jgi:putative membrane-bound dehydrogenase-like protein
MFTRMKHLACLLSLLLPLAAAEPRTPAGAFNGALTPEQAVAAFKLEAGLRIEIAAAEPFTIDPVAIAFDEQGRMFVAENRGYPTGPGEGKPPEGIIALLEDTNGDGRYDKRTVFADNLTFPNGLMVWRGGLIVTCAPDIFYFKDTDADGKADSRKVLLTGFTTTTTTQLRVSHPTLGLDNWIYLTSGLTGGKISAPDHPGRPVVEITKGDSRFRPDSLEFETNPGAAQFGLTFDDFGRKFVCSNRNPLQNAVLPPRYLKRNPYLPFSETMQEVSPFGDAAKVYPLSQDTTTASYMPVLMAAPHAGTFTSASGISIYRGTALPPAYYGNAFVCEPAQNLVQRQVVSANGATFASRPAQAGNKEFLATADGWFRPVFAANGPDGGLYICDMYRKTIDHPQYLPESIRTNADFVSGKEMGRIYRVVSAQQPKMAARPVNLGKASTKDLCAELNHANGWQRDTARRLLVERQDKTAVPILKTGLRNPKSRPTGRAAALRTLESLGAIEDEQLLQALSDTDPGVREHGIQLAEPRLGQSPALAARLLALAEDKDTRVRFLSALSLGELTNASVTPALATIALRSPEDRWTRAAALSSIGKSADEFLKVVLEQHRNGVALAPPLMQDLGQILAASQPPAKVTGAVKDLMAFTQPADFPWQLAALSGVANGLRGRGPAAKDKSPLMGLVATDAATSERVTAAFQQALALAKTAGRPNADRVVALQFLAHSDYATAGAALQSLIGSTEPAEIQVAAVRSLGLLNDPTVGPAFVTRERWRAYSPAVREAVVSTLLAQVRLVPALLEAIERGAVPAWAVDPARRTQLLKHRDEAIRKRAETAFAHLQSGDRMKIYEEYKPVLAGKADMKSGKAVFARLCTPCHVYNGEGSRVGPELTGIRNQPAEALLLHIIVPDYEIVAGFMSYEIETKDGRSLTGLLASESATSVTLRRALGEEENILRSNIASIASTSLSLMPQELEKAMTRQEMADLIGFLKGE